MELAQGGDNAALCGFYNNAIWRYNYSMTKSVCKFCNTEITRRGKKVPVFCSVRCKSEWQKTQKPVTKEWLEHKYLVEKLGTYQIASLVNRNAKQVYNWLIGYGIPVRDRGKAVALFNKSTRARKARSLSATNRIMTDETKRKISKAKTGKSYPNLEGKNNGMYGVKGNSHPNWQGGTAPERQKIHSSLKWKKVARTVWLRDDGTCQRCGSKYDHTEQFDIHHKKSFSVVALRYDPDNLIVLCHKCHLWVHSSKNTQRELIEE